MALRMVKFLSPGLKTPAQQTRYRSYCRHGLLGSCGTGHLVHSGLPTSSGAMVGMMQHPGRSFAQQPAESRPLEISMQTDLNSS